MGAAALLTCQFTESWSSGFILLLPSLFSVAVTYFDDFGLAYGVVGGLAALSGWLLWQQKNI